VTPAKAKRVGQRSKEWPRGTPVRYKAGNRWMVCVVTRDHHPEADKVELAEWHTPEEVWSSVDRSRVFVLPAGWNAAVSEEPPLGEPDFTVKVTKKFARLAAKALADDAPHLVDGFKGGDAVDYAALELGEEGDIVVALMNGKRNQYRPFVSVTLRSDEGETLYECPPSKRLLGRSLLVIGDAEKVVEVVA
jgi:hypothetical protein